MRGRPGERQGSTRKGKDPSTAPAGASREVVGLIPAAGQATRLGPVPGSKEVLPIGWVEPEGGGRPRPRVVCEYLLEAMRLAGIRRVLVVLRDGKWDVPAYLGDGSRFDLHLAYLLMGLPHGAPFTLDQAYPFVKDLTVALGFPDIIFDPEDAYARVLDHLAASGADVVLGLFPAADPTSCDMLSLAEGSRVSRIEIKPRRTRLEETWGVAVWTPIFTRFLHDHLAEVVARARRGARGVPELHVGDVVQAAIERGLRVEGVRVSDRPYLDVGTPESLREALRRFNP